MYKFVPQKSAIQTEDRQVSMLPYKSALITHFHCIYFVKEVDENVASAVHKLDPWTLIHLQSLWPREGVTPQPGHTSSYVHIRKKNN